MDSYCFLLCFHMVLCLYLPGEGITAISRAIWVMPRHSKKQANNRFADHGLPDSWGCQAKVLPLHYGRAEALMAKEGHCTCR